MSKYSLLTGHGYSDASLTTLEHSRGLDSFTVLGGRDFNQRFNYFSLVYNTLAKDFLSPQLPFLFFRDHKISGIIHSVVETVCYLFMVYFGLANSTSFGLSNYPELMDPEIIFTIIFTLCVFPLTFVRFLTALQERNYPLHKILNFYRVNTTNTFSTVRSPKGVPNVFYEAKIDLYQRTLQCNVEGLDRTLILSRLAAVGRTGEFAILVLMANNKWYNAYRATFRRAYFSFFMKLLVTIAVYSDFAFSIDTAVSYVICGAFILDVGSWISWKIAILRL